MVNILDALIVADLKRGGNNGFNINNGRISTFQIMAVWFLFSWFIMDENS